MSSSFEGVVVGVPSSFRMVIQPKGKPNLVTLIPACLRVPSGTDEPLSFNARDTLRKQFLGHEVQCTVVREHARVRRVADGLEATISLVKSGLALCNDNERVYNDFSDHKRHLLTLQEGAKSRGIGLHDPCIRGASTIRRVISLPSKAENTLAFRATVQALVNPDTTQRFSVEKITSTVSYGGFLTNSLHSIAVRLIGFVSVPSSEAVQRLTAKLIHRVITIRIHDYDVDTGEFLVELTSLVYNRLLGELLAARQLGLDCALVLSSSGQLPSDAITDALSDFIFVPKKNQELLLCERNNDLDVSESVNITTAAISTPTPASKEGGFNISLLNMEDALEADLHELHQVNAAVAEDILEIIDPSAHEPPTSIANEIMPSQDHHIASKDSHDMFATESPSSPLIATSGFEYSLPLAQELPSKHGAFRSGVVVGVRNELTIDILEERDTNRHASRSRRSGKSAGRAAAAATAATTVREYHKIRLIGLGAPAAIEESPSDHQSLIVTLERVAFRLREFLRQLIIGREVFFSMAHNQRTNRDDSISASVFIALPPPPPIVRSYPGTSTSNFNGGYLDLTSFIRQLRRSLDVVVPRPITNLEGANNESASAAQEVVEVAQEVVETKPPPTPEPAAEKLPSVSLDLNRFDYLLARGAPTPLELQMIIAGLWTVDVHQDMTVDVLNGVSNTTADVPTPTVAPESIAESGQHVPPPAPIANPGDAMFADISAEAPLAPEPLSNFIHIDYVATENLLEAFDALGSIVPETIHRQTILTVIEEYAPPLQLSLYFPELQLQFPFTLKYARLPPADVEMLKTVAAAAQTRLDQEDNGKRKADRGRGRRKGKGGANEQDVDHGADETAESSGPSERELAVHHELFDFLEESLVHRDCQAFVADLDRESGLLKGDILLPFAQLTARYQHLLKSALQDSGDGEAVATADDDDDSAAPPPDSIDLLHALVVLGFTYVDPVAIMRSDLPTPLIVKIVEAQSSAKRAGRGIWDARCPLLRAISGYHEGCGLDVKSQQVYRPMIAIDAPRPSVRARRIVPLRNEDPLSFLFRYDDEEYWSQAEAFQSLCHRTAIHKHHARYNTGQTVVLDMGHDYWSPKSGSRGSKILRYSRVQITSRVLSGKCFVHNLDSGERDQVVSVRDIRLLDEAGQIETFPPLCHMGHHSFVSINAIGRKAIHDAKHALEAHDREVAAAKRKERAAAQSASQAAHDSATNEAVEPVPPQAENTSPVSEVPGDKKGRRRQRGRVDTTSAVAADTKETPAQNTVAVKSEVLTLPDAATVLHNSLRKTLHRAKVSEGLFLFQQAEALTSAEALYFSAEYEGPDKSLYGFVFSANGNQPCLDTPPISFTLLHRCHHLVELHCQLAYHDVVFIPLLRHLHDLLNTESGGPVH